MNYNAKYINFSFKSFCIVSILLFSFAPWLALESVFTQMISKLLYVLWFINFSSICIFGEFSKQKLKRCIFLFILIIVFSVFGITKVGVKPFASQFLNLIIPIIVAVLFYSLNNVRLTKKDLSILVSILFVCVFLNCI